MTFYKPLQQHNPFSYTWKLSRKESDDVTSTSSLSLNSLSPLPFPSSISSYTHQYRPQEQHNPLNTARTLSRKGSDDATLTASLSLNSLTSSLPFLNNCVLSAAEPQTQHAPYAGPGAGEGGANHIQRKQTGEVRRAKRIGVAVGRWDSPDLEMFLADSVLPECVLMR